MRYIVKARIYPAVISIIPIIIFFHFYLNNIVSDLFNLVINIKWLGDISISVIFIYLFVQINRFIGKELYEKIYFKNELYMPTTNYLMHSNEKYSKDYKTKIYSKIKNDFGIELVTHEEEEANNLEARRKIVEAAGQIRQKVKNGHLLLQHNIEYGFVRNFIGGSTVAFLLSLMNLYIFYYISYNKIAFGISIFTAIFYLMPIILSKIIINKFGNLYAQRLIMEYMSLK